MLGIFGNAYARLLLVAAWAGAAQHFHLMTLFLLAAVATLVDAPQPLLPAAAGMVRPALGGTAADVAIAGAFSGHGESESGRVADQ